MFTKRLIPFALVVLFAGAVSAEETDLFVRRFPVDPSFVYLLRPPSTNEFVSIGDIPPDLSSKDLPFKDFLIKCGIQFPEGSYVTYQPSTSSLLHYNTKENHLLFGQLLRDDGTIHAQVRFDALFVDFPNEEIEKLARANFSPYPRSEDILALWKEGQGTMLHALKLITRSGVNAQITGASEQIYATEFNASSGTNTATEFPVPGGFDKLDVGPTLNVTPTVGPDGETIDVVMAPEIISLVKQNQITVTRADDEGKEIHLAVPQPLFHTRLMTTSFVMKDQSTQVLGGMPNPTGDGMTYLFLTVTLIDRTGQPMMNYMGEAIP